MKARYWNRCEVRLGGCNGHVDFLIHVESRTPNFIPKQRNLVVCSNCRDNLAACGLVDVTVKVDLCEVKSEVWR